MERSDVVSYQLEVGGATVRYHLLGPKNRGKPILLLHGTGGSTHTHYANIMENLARDHHVIGVDFGEAKTLDDLVNQAEAVLNLHAPFGAHLVGYSLGAVAAAATAAHSATKIEKLVLLCGWAKSDDLQKFRYQLWQRLHKSDPEALRAIGTLLSHGHTYLRDRTIEDIRSISAKRVVSDVTEQQNAINASVDILPALKHIDASTLVVAGTFDRMAPPEQSHLLQRNIRNSELVELPTGHACLAEMPQRVYELISDFVQAPHIHAEGRD